MITASLPTLPTPAREWPALEQHLHEWHGVSYGQLDRLDTAGMATLHSELHTTFRWTKRARLHAHE